MSLLEQDHQEGAGVRERYEVYKNTTIYEMYEIYKMYKMYEMYEIAKVLPVTPNGLHPRWLDL